MSRSLLRHPSTWTGALAVLLHLGVLPFFAAAGLLAPGWAAVLLLAAWALLAAVLVVLVRRRSPLALLVPAVAVALWFGALAARPARPARLDGLTFDRLTPSTWHRGTRST